MNELQWSEQNGWGYLAPDVPCKKDYWTEYRELDKTPMGRVLTALRAGFVTYWENMLGRRMVDVGIGGGAFVKSTGCRGIDVDPKALEWLDKNWLLWNFEPIPVMTFWDSLEHIQNLGEYLGKAQEWVFISTPIYDDEAHCRRSKHYKPGEHLWYFTDRGLKKFMKNVGFRCLGQNNLENDAGREGIGSYVFQRS